MKRKVFITGISGFVGSHLAESLAQNPEFEIFGTVFGDGYRAREVPQQNFYELNLLDREKTLSLVKQIEPHWIFHLAALSSPVASFQDPRKTLTNNIEGQINLLDGLVGMKQVQRILVIGSAEEYGAVSPDLMPIKESADLQPRSPYAVSKIAQDYLGLQYFLHYKLPVVRVRPFNHTGERQAPMFVVPAFAKQIAEIEAGLQAPEVKVGNLDAVRDFTDVKDMVAAYILAMELGQNGAVYNLGSGKGYQIKQILDELINQSKIKIAISRDPQRMQPSDIPKLICNYDLFHDLTGWQPKIPFHTTIARVLDYWRQEIKKNKDVI